MINLYDIKEGDKVVLKNGKTGTCTENMGDGQWIEIESDNETVLVHSQEIQDVIKAE
ncbi:TPA: hypothetical protein U2K59_003407 [Acinetobacter baumannii]|nr:hypothetical protein [Acinetobacter baumannii]